MTPRIRRNLQECNRKDFVSVIYLSERAFALRLGVGRSTVARWRETGRLRYLRIGDVIRYRVEDVERFELEHSVEAVVIGLKRPSPIRRNDA